MAQVNLSLRQLDVVEQALSLFIGAIEHLAQELREGTHSEILDNRWRVAKGALDEIRRARQGGGLT